MEGLKYQKQRADNLQAQLESAERRIEKMVRRADKLQAELECARLRIGKMARIGVAMGLIIEALRPWMKIMEHEKRGAVQSLSRLLKEYDSIDKEE